MNQRLLSYCIGCILTLGSVNICFAQGRFISFTSGGSGLLLGTSGHVLDIYTGHQEWAGVTIAVKSLGEDFNRVLGLAAKTKTRLPSPSGHRNAILVGTVGHSELIDALVAAGKIKVGGLAGQWESSLIQTVINPVPGIDTALVIAGSDKRGTIYGVYELSRQMGVSPWYYWADVPTAQQKAIYALDKKVILEPSAVKYRGIFLNDEAPALAGWASEKFGGFNHRFYIHVFELLLRLKANYLWPAMWGHAFNDDDSLNPVLADRYGIVMGTSHHEPMLRAQQEWKRYGKGEWNYPHNKQVFKGFWKTGIKHMGTHESIVTIGMRGDGDMPMTEGSNISLLESIVKDQRKIIADVTGRLPEKTPQLWALYKEVQDYYDKGMRVPDDVTLLFCDDNWGNIRKLPKLTDPYRSGGYGIYYHFDYVGGPRNYKWINTNPIDKVWEQMHLAYQYGVDKIWIVNVGDLKPMEFPISFFLDYARNPDRIPYEGLKEYTLDWCRQQFGSDHAVAIADILTTYGKYNGRVKPELLSRKTYSLMNFREWDRVCSDYERLAKRSQSIYLQLPKAFRAAYFELIDYPVKASANLYALYAAQAKNHLYARQGRSATNKYADSVAWYYLQDSLLTIQYNQINADGKWNHMMDQTHIGYTSWQEPDRNRMPEVRRIKVPSTPLFGVAIQGDTSCLGGHKRSADLPVLNPEVNNFVNQNFALFSRSAKPVAYEISTKSPWIHLKLQSGILSPGVEKLPVFYTIDWDKAPRKIAKAPVLIRSGQQSYTVWVHINNRPLAQKPAGAFVSENHQVSFDAGDFQKATGLEAIHWKKLPGYGKTNNAVTPVPVTFKPLDFSLENPCVSYPFFSRDSGRLHLTIYLAPTLDTRSMGGLKFAMAIDDSEPRTININKNSSSEAQWSKDVAGNIRKLVEAFTVKNSGAHTLKVWAISPGVVIEKFELNFGPAKKSFLGAPPSFFAPERIATY